MKYFGGLVVAWVNCDQRSAFSENTTGTIWCVFQRVGKLEIGRVAKLVWGFVLVTWI